MKFIAHRINTVKELTEIDKSYGVEIDLRDQGNDLILAHDPFSSGESLDYYLSNYKHGTIILNIKSERIEFRVLDLLKKHNISDYFFLDSSFPMIYQLTKSNEKKMALRYSEFEGLDTIKNMAGKCEFIWVDCFTHFPLTKEHYFDFKNLGYKLVLVSPELQGRPQDIEHMANEIMKRSIEFDIICTKYFNIDLWKKCLKIN